MTGRWPLPQESSAPWLLARFIMECPIRVLVLAADHQPLEVPDQRQRLIP